MRSTSRLTSPPRRRVGLAIAGGLLAGCGGGGGGGGEMAPDGGGPVIPFVDFVAARSVALADTTSFFAVAAADWNEDGRADVLAIRTTSEGRRLEILLADAEGLPALHFALGSEDVGATPFLVADFDEDTHLDLIARVATSDSDGVFLRGDGTGRLEEPVPIGYLPANSAAADFDEDGHVDLVTELGAPFPLPGDVGLRLGDGAATFGLPVALGLESGGRVRAAELSGDGHVDLIVVHAIFFPGGSGGETFVYVGDGRGAFVRASLLNTGFTSIDLADFDGDGSLDIAECSYVTDSRGHPFGHRVVRLNDGTARGWTTSYSVASPTLPPIIAADWSADGRPDLLTAGSVLVGDGLGGFGSSIFPEGLFVGSGMLSADFDADGSVDLMNGGGSRIHVVQGGFRGGLRVAPTVHLGEDPVATTVGDVDGDGLDDAIALFEDGRLVSLVNDGDGALVLGSPVDVGLHVTAIDVADLNGDGFLDVALTRADPRAIDVFAGDGRGEFARIQSSAVSGVASAIVLSDVDSDGRADAVLALQEENEVSISFGSGGGRFGRERVVTGVERPSCLVVARLDGGQRSDDIAVGGFCGVSVLLRGANGSWSPPQFLDLGADATAIAASDFDEDGRTDLVPALRAIDGGGSIVMLRQVEPGQFSPGIAPLPAIDDEPTSIVARDLNDDGHADIAVTSRNSAELALAIGDGTGGMATVRRFGTRPMPTRVAVARLDSDAREDLIVFSASGGFAAAFVNVSDESGASARTGSRGGE